MTVRILWDTDNWFRFNTANGDAKAWSNDGGTPTNGAQSNANGLILQNKTDFKGKNPASLLASPRIGDWLSWTLGAADQLGANTPVDRRGGRLPTGEDWYTVRISLPEAQQVDCFCIVGIENADITIYHSDTGGDTAWTELTGIDSYNDLEMRQSECWGRVVSKKFITFTAQTKRYWRFDFAAVPGLPFFGLISTIMGGVHYEMETPLGARFDWRNRSPGASSGGLWHSEFRDDPVFPSMPFIFDYAPFNDLAETQQMIRERTNGDPIAIQFNPFYHPDFYLAYGVIADDSGVDPVILEDQTNISFRVNVLEPSRNKGYLI